MSDVDFYQKKIGWFLKFLDYPKETEKEFREIKQNGNNSEKLKNLHARLVQEYDSRRLR